MPRKNTDLGDFQEGELAEEVWSKKRILIGLLTLCFVVGSLGYFGTGFVTDALRSREVLGKQTPIQEIEIPNQEEVNKILVNAKEELSQITSENITASESAIQKIIQDLERLQGGDTDAKNIVCGYVCR